MRNLIIILNHLPPPELNPNRIRSIHWTKRSEVEQNARKEVWVEACNAWDNGKPMTKARISYDFILKSKRERDLDNLYAATKPYTDGVVDAGVLISDSINCLQIGHIIANYGDHDETMITVEEL